MVTGTYQQKKLFCEASTKSQRGRGPQNHKYRVVARAGNGGYCGASSGVARMFQHSIEGVVSKP